MEYISRFFREPDQSFFLFGPRGTGKSTWISQHFKNVSRIDLLSPEVFRTFSGMPERLRELVHAQPQEEVFVVDEIQKVPALLDVVHALLEEKQGWKFVLTGSSARKLKRGGVDLLAGRAVERSLHPFMAAELGSLFKLEDALEYGLLPVVWTSKTPRDVLQAYASLYLREEVQWEGLVRNIGGFSRFLESITFSHAAVLNITQVARECQVERKVVENYVSILEDLLLAFRIPVFTRRTKRAMAAHSKFFLFDAGVYRSLRPRGPLDRPEEMHGAALEGLVAQHLRAWNAYRGEVNRLYYWRTRSGSEVDFVVYGSDGLWAVEVKNSARVDPGDLRALRAFREDYPESRALLLYRGEQRLKIHEVLCVPCEEFLRQLHPSKNLEQGLGL